MTRPAVIKVDLITTQSSDRRTGLWRGGGGGEVYGAGFGLEENLNGISRIEDDLDQSASSTFQDQVRSKNGHRRNFLMSTVYYTQYVITRGPLDSFASQTIFVTWLFLPNGINNTESFEGFSPKDSFS